MGLAIGTEYPAFQAAARQLVLSHLRLPDETLLFAAYYAPVERDHNDVFVFEIVQDFGGNVIDEERCFLEVTYGSSDALPLDPDQRLHLVVTSPSEFDTAVREGWRHVRELQEAVRRGKFQKLYPRKKSPWEAKLRG